MRWIKGVGLGQQRSPQQVKPKYNKRAHTNGRKGNPRESREDQRDHTTESHQGPMTEVHPTKTADKAEHQESHRQKDSPKMGRQRKNLQLKRMEDSPVKELNEMEASKLSDVEFERMVIRMLKELTENYKELSGNYNSMKKK